MKKKSASKKPSLQQVILDALADLKAQNIVVLDVTTLTDVTDTLVIASGSSNRQVRALAEHAAEQAKKQGMLTIGVEGLDAGEWVLADFGDVVLHVMQPEIREFYDLERLWQAPETAAAAATTKAGEKPAAARKTVARKPAADKATEEPAIETQGAKARARKAPPKPSTRKPAAKTAAKTGTEKAGVYAKTGTRKPAAKKTATASATAGKPASKKAVPAAKKPAAKKSRAAIGISTAAKAGKPAARKPRKP